MKWPARTMMTATVLAVCGVCAWIFIPTRTAPTPIQAAATPLPAAPILRAEPTLNLTPPKPLKVYRPAVKAKLKLPASVVEDAGQHVTASARMTADDKPYTLTAVLDTATGASTIYAKAEPLPLFALTARGEAGIAYGLRDGVPMGRLYVMQDVAQIKAVRLGALATLDQDGRYFIGVRAGYRW